MRNTRFFDFRSKRLDRQDQVSRAAEARKPKLKPFFPKNYAKVIALMIALVLTQKGVLSAECFPRNQSLLPKVLVGKDGSGNADPVNEVYYSIVGNDDFVIYGGTVDNDNLFYGTMSQVAVLTRMDLATNSIRWMRTYDADDGGTTHVEGLALKHDDASALAVYARQVRPNGFDRGYNVGYLFVVDPVDGGHLTTKALKLEHDTDNSNFRWLTSSSAMFFNDYGKVIIGWYLYRGDNSDSNGYDMGNNQEYEGKLRVGQYHYTNSET